jgi:hypothetical protein
MDLVVSRSRSAIGRSLRLTAAFVALAGGVAPAGAFHALPFESPVRVLDVAGPVLRAVVGDVDGDGHLDLVETGDDLVVQFGTATRGIGPRVSAPVTIQYDPGSLVLADLDGDGRPEILAPLAQDPNGYDWSLRVLRCTPERVLELILEIPNGVLAAPGDFDGDGDTDLAITYSFGIPRILRNDGGMTFTAVADLPAYSHTWDPIVSGRDVDGDGRHELLVHSRETHLVSNLETIRFFGPGFDYTRTITFIGSGSPRELGLADLDGDGILDVVRPHAPIELWQGQADGTFLSRGTLPSPVAFPPAIAIGDGDGDGRPDLVVADGPGRGIQTYRNLGDFAFAAPAFRASGNTPLALALSDVDGDGRLDPLVIGHEGAGVVTPTTGPVVAPAPSFATGDAPTVVRVGDVDANGRRDFIVLNSSAASLTLYRTAPDGTHERSDVPLGGIPRDVAVADLDADGADDLVTLHSTAPASVRVRRSDGAGGFAAPLSFDVPPGPVEVQVADLDADGTLDLFVRTSQAIARPFRGDGAGGFVAAPDIALPAGITRSLLAPLAGDARPDLVIVVPPQQSFAVLVAEGPGIAFGAATSRVVPAGADAIETIDADSDGLLDLVFCGAAGTGPGLALNLGGGQFGPFADLHAGPALVDLAAGDWDGDGIPDLVALARVLAAGGVPGAAHFLRGRGDGTFDPSLSLQVMSDPRHLAFDDVTGDGHPDVLLSSQPSDLVSLLVNQRAPAVAVGPGPGSGGLALRISPNPARGPLQVAFSGRPLLPVRVAIFDVRGRRVLPVSEVRADATGRAVLAFAPPGRAGVYLARAEQAGQAVVARLVMLDGTAMGAPPLR